ncbi:MAG TPA: cellulose binding domain-containing protein [Streptosporangiaceae bacterium]
MASGPAQPAPGPGRLADSLARHPWITAAGMTAAVAAVASGAVVLAFHDSSSRPGRDCGLVSCAAALPAAVRSTGTGPVSGTGSASTPAAATPAATRRASTPARPASPTVPVSAKPVSVPEPFSSPAPVSSSSGRAVSADHAIGVGYEITEDSQHGIHGQIVIANESSAPVRGWRVTIVLPGDTDYQVLNAGNRSAGDAVIMAAPAAGHALAAGSTELIAFTARGSTSTPVRCTFTDSARSRHSGRHGSGDAAGQDASQAAAGQPGSAEHGHHGWLGGWPTGGWPTGGWPTGGWPTGGWPGQGRRGGGGRDGHQHGWPGGR